jgi:hypothetical protein
MGDSSVRRWVKHFKDGNRDIAYEPHCGRPKNSCSRAQQAKSRKAHQIRPKDVRRSTNFVMRFMKNVRKRKVSSFNMTTRGLILQVWPCNLKDRLGTALPFTLHSGLGPLRLPLDRTLERSLERSPVRDWRGSPGSRAKLVARSWKGLLLHRHI